MKQIYIIAEIGINSNGSVELTKELIDKAHRSGCHAVKLQKRTIDLVYTKEELDAYRDSPWGTTNREQKEGLEFSIEQHKEFESYSNSKGLDYFVSCWDEESLDLVERNLNVKYHKIPSALLTSRSFIEKVNSTGKKVIVSTGMTTSEEIDNAISLLDNVEYILACTSTYPTKDDEVNLNYITTLKNKYKDIKIGFSNHSNGLTACYGAAALGVECIEFHITKDRTMYGSDQAASIENSDDLVSGSLRISNMLGDGSKKVYESELPIIQKLRKVNDLLF
jgi:N-acetylneuraminate synthase